ncbi:hypothetical protein CBR_g46385 [Chara braunii]|uniref:Reverse transcriptase domain-containing protein n=1 Tax=Chara braunii TaxID=69332 RepID=A0A388M0B4_CHABU|nr:hypothetical protein CBR_g46385 [Chara braunii]|eukprot:GBG88014.1 hypothetical protein CBR_g46385 [Chara braunii]
MAMEKETDNRKSEGEPGLGGSAAQSEGGQKDRESINPDGTKGNRKEISIGESSGKAGGSRQGTQGTKEGRNKDRTSPRNSEGAVPKKVRVTDTRRRLAEIENMTAEYKARLIAEMMTGNEEGPLQEEPRDERKASQGEVTDLLRAKMDSFVAEPTASPYANRWFVFRKPNKTLRWIQDLQKLNAVTIRDASSLPQADLLAESHAGRGIYSLIDLYSGYDQLPLDVRDRPYTAMHIPVGQLQMQVTLMGFTNAVAEAQRRMLAVVGDMFPVKCEPYIDDNPIKGAQEKDETKVQPRIRRFVWDHLQDIKNLLHRFLVYNITASGPKSILAVPEVTILRFHCSAYGRKPDPAKTDKISQWPTPLRTTTEVRAFLCVVGFWRIFIKNFAKIAQPIRAVIREEGTMDWTEEREGAVQRLKDILTSETVALFVPCFTDEVGRPFILETDGGPLAVGGSKRKEKMEFGDENDSGAINRPTGEEGAGLSQGRRATKRKLYIGLMGGPVVGRGGRKCLCRKLSPLHEGEGIEIPSDSEGGKEKAEVEEGGNTEMGNKVQVSDGKGVNRGKRRETWHGESEGGQDVRDKYEEGEERRESPLEGRSGHDSCEGYGMGTKIPFTYDSKNLAGEYSPIQTEDEEDEEEDVREVIEISIGDERDEISRPREEGRLPMHQLSNGAFRWEDEFGPTPSHWFQQWTNVIRHEWIIKTRELARAGVEATPLDFFNEAELRKIVRMKREIETYGVGVRKPAEEQGGPGNEQVEAQDSNRH